MIHTGDHGSKSQPLPSLLGERTALSGEGCLGLREWSVEPLATGGESRDPQG